MFQGWLLGMYAYACFMDVYAYSKCEYAYNWDAHAYPMYVHEHSRLETNILFSQFSFVFFHMFSLYVIFSSHVLSLGSAD